MKPDTPSKRDLILLFGMPRSSTTWIGKVFDSHPEEVYRHEPDSQFQLREILELLPSSPDPGRYREKLEEYVADRQTEQILDASTQQTKAGYYSVYKDPLKSANKWQEELNSEDVAMIKALTMEHPIGAWFLSTEQTA